MERPIRRNPIGTVSTRAARRAWPLLALALGACGKEGSEVIVAGSSDAPLPTELVLPRFTDVLEGSGIEFRHHFLDSETGSTYRINPYDHGSGVCVVDVDGDGLEDVYLLDFLGPNALYLNRGGMRFEDVTEQAGVAVPRSLSVGAAFGDYDGDGDPDLYVTTYRGGNRLFRNEGGARFVDVTDASGTGHTGHSNSAAWFDYDLDGDLDLYLCNIGVFTTETISREADYFYVGEALPFREVAKTPDRRAPGESDVLFRNEGDGTFTDVTKAAGISSDEWNGDVAIADVDLDGDLDLYVSNMFGANHLFRNEGDGTFVEATQEALGRTSWGGMGARFFDANGDAHPDLYVVDMHSDMWIDPDEGARGFRPTEKFNTPLGTSVGGGKAIAKPDDTQARSVLFGNTFFVNDGDGTFTERSAEAGLENWWPWGLAAGDFNNDGTEDVFVSAGMGFPFVYWPNHLYLNGGDGRFYEVAAVVGIEPPRLGTEVEGAAIRGHAFTRSSRSVAAADLDRDGDLDLVVNNFNHEPYLLRNDSRPQSWLQVRLRPKQAGAAAGARVTVVAGGRSFHRASSAGGGYLTQSSPVVHFGLDGVEEVDRVEVRWPGGGAPQVLEAPAVNQVLDVVQE